MKARVVSPRYPTVAHAASSTSRATTTLGIACRVSQAAKLPGGVILSLSVSPSITHRVVLPSFCLPQTHDPKSKTPLRPVAYSHKPALNHVSASPLHFRPIDRDTCRIQRTKSPQRGILSSIADRIICASTECDIRYHNASTVPLSTHHGHEDTAARIVSQTCAHRPTIYACVALFLPTGNRGYLAFGLNPEHQNPAHISFPAISPPLFSRYLPARTSALISRFRLGHANR